MASDLYYNGNQTWATADSASSTVYSTAAGPSQTWYYYDNDGELIQSDAPQHTHEMPSHNHSISNGSGGWNGWRIQKPPEDLAFSVGGEQIMKYKDDLHIKIDGDWISVKDLSLRIKTLEVITEKLYNLLSPWQKNVILNVDKMELEEKDDEFEHFDPDLFKV